MKRTAEWVYWLPLGVLSLVGLLHVPGAVPLRQQVDMPLLLDGIDAAGGLAGCGRWFAGDWPIGNHLYRPVATCSLALDRAVWGDWAPGYLLTNWACLALTGVLLSLLVRAVGAGRAAGALTGSLFLAQQWVYGHGPFTPRFLFGVAVGAAAVMALRELARGRRVARVDEAAVGSECEERLGGSLALRVPMGLGGSLALPAVAAVTLVLERYPLQLPAHWAAARTAVLCTLLAVGALLALARHLRTGRPLSALAVVLLTALALGTYEQGVVVPLLVGVFALARRPAGARFAWGVVAPCLLLLPLYLGVRAAALGSDTSGYQAAAFHVDVMGAARWAFYVVWPHVVTFWDYGAIGTPLWGLGGMAFWWSMAEAACIPSIVAAIRRSWRTSLPFLAWKVGAYLPMAPLRPMDHYLLLSEAGACALAAVLLTTTFACPTRACLPDPVKGE